MEFLFLKNRIRVNKKDAARILNVCMRRELRYSNPEFRGQSFYLTVGEFQKKELLRICGEREIECEVERLGELPALLLLCKNRVGIILGAVICLIIMLVSSNVVWRVETVGNTAISDGKIEDILAENGFGVGSIIRKTDFKRLENRVMMNSSDIAWLSVNMNGTVAVVQVIESKIGDKEEATPSNLVAVRDGKIERIEVYNGNVEVKIGDVVRAGELLVGGVYENESGSYRTTRAEGAVYARTLHDISVEIPFEFERKVYVREKCGEFCINFFRKRIKVFRNSRNVPSTCDIIYKNGEVGVFSLPEIPIGFEKTIYREYEIVPSSLDEREAMEKAFETLQKELKKISEGGELLRKSTDFRITDTSYVLNCTLEVVENIATEQIIDTQ